MKMERSSSEENDHISVTANAIDDSISEEKKEKNDEHFGTGSSISKMRPTNLQDLLSDENLCRDTTEANFQLSDISDSEEIWIFDVPKTINPKKFKGQTIKLGGQNHFKIGNELYETSSVRSKDHQRLSFVFNTSRRKRPYKMVNMKPAGSLRVRQKLESVLDAKLVFKKKAVIPFPKNLKIRHPLFGHDYNKKLIAVDK